MKKLSTPYMARCIGCHSCALACARLVHKKLSWTTSGIQIRSSGGLSTGFEASLCHACEPASCAAACPTGACVQRPGGGVKKNAGLCLRCGKCAAACPLDAVHVDVESGEPYVCIHCGRCVPFCPHDCLALTNIPGTEKSGEAPHAD
jgi:Fe-S-cluster-containing hydrogenase component 2